MVTHDISVHLVSVTACVLYNADYWDCILASIYYIKMIP